MHYCLPSGQKQSLWVYFWQYGTVFCMPN